MPGRPTGTATARRMVVVGLDGTPFTLIQRLMSEGHLPNFSRIVRDGSLRRMNSVYPVVSSTAWASFMTGKNPANHGIFGFVDCHPGTYNPYIPTARNVISPTLWDVLGREGRRVSVMNVPVTYPPREVNGVLVSCFLTPDVAKSTYPAELAGTLKSMDYRLDIDPWAARKSKDLLLQEFDVVLAHRAQAMWHIWRQERWDFSMIHIMETDRLQHFLWEQYEQGDATYAPEFVRRYQQVDALLGEIQDSLDDDTQLVIVSDHGFASIKYEVYVNHWLQQAGWLKLKPKPVEMPKNAVYPSLPFIDDNSRAYSMDPGRVYINLAGRQPNGCVPPSQYHDVREAVARDILDNMRDPQTGQPMIEKIIRKEEIYHGSLYDQAPDLILSPYNGYDLKGAFRPDFLAKSELVGMHTYDDALLYVSGQEITKPDISILDVMPTILSMMDVPLPRDLEGQSAVRAPALTRA